MAGFSTEFVCLFLTCFCLLGVSWYLMRDSVEMFRGMVRDTDQLVPATILGRLRLMAEGALFVSVTVAAGLWLSHRVGVRPLALTSSNGMPQSALMVLGRGLLGGVLVTLAFDLPRCLFFRKHLSKWDESVSLAEWRKYLGAGIGAGVAEEVVFRLLLFPLLAWLLGLLWHTPEGFPTASVLWVSLIAVSLLFAATHVPIVRDLEEYTVSSVLRAMLVFFPPGLMLGCAYWWYGIETAILAHASGLWIGWFYIGLYRATAKRGG